MLEDLDRLNHLINQMLDAGRAESERDEEEVVLSAVIEECADIARRRHGAPDESVRLSLEPCAIRGSRPDAVMIFRNLLDNALKYSGTPPSVTVDLVLGARGVATARIADNGRGIPAEMRRRVFGRFVRLGSELTRERPGTGLGLFIAQAAARRLSGRIRVEDRSPGTGAVFEVDLPKAFGTEAEPAA